MKCKKTFKAEKLTKNQEIIVELIKKNKNISKDEMIKKGKLSKKTVDYNLNVFKNKGVVKRVGSDKGGYWDVVK